MKRILYTWLLIIPIWLLAAPQDANDLSEFASSQPTVTKVSNLNSLPVKQNPTVSETPAKDNDSQEDSQIDYLSEKSWEIWTTHFQGQYETRARRVILGLMFWILLVAGLSLYGLHYFHCSAGLGRNRYRHLVHLIDHDDSIPVAEKANSYPQNPYKDETFGLPKGTVRGILTYTLLLINCMLFYIQVYAPPTGIFDKTIEMFQTAFLMMIAFYFGSKAAEVLKSREESRRKIAEVTGAVQTTMAKIKKILPILDRPTTSPEKEADAIPSASVKLPHTHQLDIRRRCLSLTAYFETSKKLDGACAIVAGNFDGQGVSLGCLQWNLGQETLQPILMHYFQYSDQTWKNDVHLRQLYQVLQRSLNTQLEWAKSIQEQRGNIWTLFPEWLDTFKILGKKTSEYQINQACAPRFDRAESWCNDWGLVSERALALMFDISVQNGMLYKKVESRNIDVKRSIAQRIVNAGSPDEAQKLMIIAEERAKATLPEWRNAVLARKTTIARGQGVVNGAQVNLDDFHISLERSFA